MSKIGKIDYKDGDVELVFDDSFLSAPRIVALDALQDIIADATHAYNYLIDNRQCTLNQYIEHLPDTTRNWSKQKKNLKKEKSGITAECEQQADSGKEGRLIDNVWAIIDTLCLSDEDGCLPRSQIALIESFIKDLGFCEVKDAAGSLHLQGWGISSQENIFKRFCNICRNKKTKAALN